jgi:hypothetical protein
MLTATDNSDKSRRYYGLYNVKGDKSKHKINIKQSISKQKSLTLVVIYEIIAEFRKKPCKISHEFRKDTF